MQTEGKHGVKLMDNNLLSFILMGYNAEVSDYYLDDHI